MDKEVLKNISAYCIVPYSVQYDSEISDSELRIYTTISSLANQKGYCFASNAYLAKILNKSARTIQRAILHLEEKGYLRRSVSKNSNDLTERKIYISYDEIFEKCEDDELSDLSRGDDKNVTGERQKCRRGTTKMSSKHDKIVTHNNISNNINNNIRVIEGEAEAEKYNYTLIAGKFIEIANKYGLSIISKLSDKRKAKLKARIDELGEGKIIEAIDKIKESSFLRGENDRHWKVDFDWLIANDTNILKVLEDKYKDEEKPEEEDDPWKKVGYRF